ncbi:hypothetical protein DFH06DRAFT_182863 [Mycena polygramma]|nr:hypothetical protein DFH06DRAFT_182863 [Mycena polygramma]
MLASLESDRARIVTLEAQISEIMRLLSTVQAEQALVQERLDSYKYPVLTLPNELVSDVFIHFLPTYPLCPPLTGIRSPQLLLQICRKWRDIALSTPALWRAISFEDPRVSALEQRERAKAWLGRSGVLPLSIQMDRDSFPRPGALGELLGVIAAHSTRWEYIKLNLSGRHSFAVGGALPLLFHLDIYAYEKRSPTMAFFDDMPRLRTVIFSHFDHPLPWSQLTSLTLIGKQPQECTPVLSHASSLRYCELVMYELLGELSVKSDITLPCLESLVLEPWSKHLRFPTQYILSFIVPSLRKLQGPGPALMHIPELVSRSGCTLQEVWITGETDAVSEQFRAAFPFIPKLSFNHKLAAWNPNEESRLLMHPIGSLAQFET